MVSPEKEVISETIAKWSKTSKLATAAYVERVSKISAVEKVFAEPIPGGIILCPVFGQDREAAFDKLCDVEYDLTHKFPKFTFLFREPITPLDLEHEELGEVLEIQFNNPVLIYQRKKG